MIKAKFATLVLFPFWGTNGFVPRPFVPKGQSVARASLSEAVEGAAPADKATPRSYYGSQDYWQDMYEGRGDHDAVEYSWYYGWDVVKAQWESAVHDKSSRVLIPGVGNDPMVLDLVAGGWTRLTAFDYSSAAIERQRDLLSFEPRALECVSLHVLDATALPRGAQGPTPECSFDAVLEKGALDAVYLSGDGQVEKSVAELARVLRPGGVCVSFSGVVPEAVRRKAFDERQWKWLRDGSSDLQAGCFIFELI
mmetsp:Transcript_32757/g.73944  ORF Transcript_32757/g.73944 Transcript_32757/m.73944 type:complete len:252 (+) Transcript_32757:77-832(+)